MLLDGEYVDGSWELHITVQGEDEKIGIRVSGSFNIRNLTRRLIEKMAPEKEWKDYAFWWPAKNIWVRNPSATLDQCGLNADSEIKFIKYRSEVQIILPSLIPVTVKLNFSSKIFAVVDNLCTQFNIRYGEEISLCLPITNDLMKEDKPTPLINLKQEETAAKFRSRAASNANEINPGSPAKFSSAENSFDGFQTMKTGKYNTVKTSHKPSRFKDRKNYNNTLSKSLGSFSGMSLPSLSSNIFENAEDSICLLDSSSITLEEAIADNLIVKPKTFHQKARLNSQWLDSYRSLMEHGLTPESGPILFFKFRFYSFYDLKGIEDRVRIHQLYEQARWSLLSEQINCSEDEMITLAALQLHVEVNDEPLDYKDQDSAFDSMDNAVDSEMEALLSELEASCVTDDDMEQTQFGAQEPCHVHVKSKKVNKHLWVMMSKSEFLLFRKEPKGSNQLPENAFLRYDFKSTELNSKINLKSNKYLIILKVIGSSGKEELSLSFPEKNKCAEWFAALKYATTGQSFKTQECFEKEMNNVIETLKLQESLNKQKTSQMTDEDLFERLKKLPDFFPAKIIKKAKSKDYLRKKTLDAHIVFRDLSALEAKLKYIQSWKNAPNFGLNYFMVRFDNKKKDTLVAVSPDRLLVLDTDSGNTQKFYLFSELRSWNIHWENEKVSLDFKSDKLVFKPVTSNSKTFIEFIGGYICLQQRVLNAGKPIEEEMFHRMTGAIRC